jgi:hypothetical protein
VLCALHRGDSFLELQPGAAYRWQGFGFSGVEDPRIPERCRDVLGTQR